MGWDEVGVYAVLQTTMLKYSRTSMARTSMGPQKIVRDMGSSSHWGIIMVPGQEGNSDNLGILFLFPSQ